MWIYIVSTGANFVVDQDFCASDLFLADDQSNRNIWGYCYWLPVRSFA